MGKLLLILAAVALLYFVFRGYRRSLGRRGQPPAEGARAAEDMVRCARCGVHLPRSESLLAGGEFFCSEQHRRLGAGK